jgi:hypothetical protein
MSALEDATRLSGMLPRAAGSDAERRAAGWLAREIELPGRRIADLEPFWCRPNWALAHAWHAALGLAGSLISVSHHALGGALVLVALLSVILDAWTGLSPGRLLTPERASQNVVSPAPAGNAPVKLIVTAGYDTGRAGLAYRHRLRRASAHVNAATGGGTPGWMGWLVLQLLALVLVAALRAHGQDHSALVAAVQIVLTVGLLIEFALLLELAISDPGPGACDSASAAVTAIALARALDAFPAANVAVELVLTGAADGQGIGLRRYLRARKPDRTATVVIGVAACGAGRPRWWVSDGPLLPLGYFGRLRAACADLAVESAHLQALPYRGRGSGPALPARMRRVPAITIGCVGDNGLVPRSHTEQDTAEFLDGQSLASTLELAVGLVDAIDAEVARVAAGRPARRPARRARARPLSNKTL